MLNPKHKEENDAEHSILIIRTSTSPKKSSVFHNLFVFSSNAKVRTVRRVVNQSLVMKKFQKSCSVVEITALQATKATN